MHVVNYREPAAPPERSRALLPDEVQRLRAELRALLLWTLLAPVLASPMLSVVLIMVVMGAVASVVPALTESAWIGSFVAAHVVYQAVMWPRLVRLWRDVRAGRTRDGEGTTRWRGAWGVEVAGRWMAAIEGDAWVPVGGPGRGRASYLPRSGRVLAFEPAPGVDAPALARALHQEALADVFRCAPAWLARNREGVLAAGQRWRLARRAAGWVALGVVAFAVFVLPFRGSLAVYGTGAAGALVAVGCWVWAARLARDALGAAVLVAAGHVTTRATPRTRNASGAYYYDVAGTSLVVSPRAHRAISAGAPHRVYYAPRSRAVVGVEVLAPSAPHA